MLVESSRQRLIEDILSLPPGSPSFVPLALAVFRYQAAHNPLYREYLRLLGRQASNVSRLEDIPFLPIRFFRNFAIQSGKWTAEQAFTSSGTSGDASSRHLLRDPGLYRRNARRVFEQFYGPLEDYCILALLPSYLERQGSSLVFMVDDFIQKSRYPQSGFFLYNKEALIEILKDNKKNNIPTLLLGVSFALWDLAEAHPMPLEGVIIMETGGMKGRRREITRQELHGILRQAFQVEAIHSEYGMTELLSQAYSKGDGVFYPGPAMRVLIREATDPFSHQGFGKTGAVNVVDLANIDTISFIAADDLGRVFPDTSFEILGRLDASGARGCNLMVADVE